MAANERANKKTATRLHRWSFRSSGLPWYLQGVETQRVPRGSGVSIVSPREDIQFLNFLHRIRRGNQFVNAFILRVTTTATNKAIKRSSKYLKRFYRRNTLSPSRHGWQSHSQKNPRWLILHTSQTYRKSGWSQP